jgi:hypothetical protein
MKSIKSYEQYIKESATSSKLYVFCHPEDAKKLKSATPIHKGKNIEDLQTMLKRLGYYKAEVDSDFGSITRKAVIAFQKANGLVTDGLVGKNTMELLTAKTKKAVDSKKKEAVAKKETPATDIEDGFFTKVGNYLSYLFTGEDASTSEAAILKSPVYKKLKSQKASDYLAKQVGYLSLLDRADSGINENFAVVDDMHKALFVFDKNFNFKKKYPIITGTDKGDDIGTTNAVFFKMKDTDPKILVKDPKVKLPSFIQKKGVPLMAYLNTKDTAEVTAVEVASEDNNVSKTRSQQLVSYWFKWRTENQENFTPSGIYSFARLEKGVRGYQDTKGGYTDGQTLRLSDRDGKLINSAIHGTISAADRIKALDKAIANIDKSSDSVELSPAHTMSAKQGEFNKTSGCTGMRGKDIDELSKALSLGSKVVILSDTAESLLILPVKSFSERFDEAGMLLMDNIYQGFVNFKHSVKKMLNSIID